MKKISIFFLIISLFFLCQSNAQIAVGDSALNFNLPDTAGNVLSLQDFSGDIILLNFFASWCIPCQIEAPQLEDSIWQVYKNQGVTIIGLNFMESIFPLINFIHQYNLTFPIVRDTAGTVFNNYGLIVLPTTIIIDQNGYVIWAEPGFDIPLMKQMIDSMLVFAETPADSKPESLIPQNLELIAVYPNPFNNNTRIKLRLNRATNIQFKIYDITGRLIQRDAFYLKNGLNEISVNLKEQASGIYLFSLIAGDEVKNGKLILEK